VSSTFPRAVRIALSVRPVLKRAGLPVEDCLPWDEARLDSFGIMDDVPLPEPQSFGVLEDGDEAWPELEEWLELHPDEPEDITCGQGTPARPFRAGRTIRPTGYTV